MEKGKKIALGFIAIIFLVAIFATAIPETEIEQKATANLSAYMIINSEYSPHSVISEDMVYLQDKPYSDKSEIKKRFLKTFSIALIIGLIYGFTALGIQNYIRTKGIHFYMSINAAIALLTKLVEIVVVVYGFFAAFLLITTTTMSESLLDDSYKILILEKMDIFVWITGFVIAFLFFYLFSIYGLELKRYDREEFFDLPAAAPAYILFFMLIIALLGYLVFSLVVGAL